MSGYLAWSADSRGSERGQPRNNYIAPTCRELYGTSREVLLTTDHDGQTWRWLQYQSLDWITWWWWFLNWKLCLERLHFFYFKLPKDFYHAHVQVFHPYLQVLDIQTTTLESGGEYSHLISYNWKIQTVNNVRQTEADAVMSELISSNFILHQADNIMLLLLPTWPNTLRCIYFIYRKHDQN